MITLLCAEGFVRQRRLERRAQPVIEARAERAVLGVPHKGAAEETCLAAAALPIRAHDALSLTTALLPRLTAGVSPWTGVATALSPKREQKR